MTKKRVFIVFLILTAMAMGLEIRLYVLMNNSVYTEAAAAQGRYTSEIVANRPQFMDRNGRLLTGTTTTELAVIRPEDAASQRVLEYIDSSYEQEFWERMDAGLPFVMETITQIPPSEPIQTVTVRERYADDNIACHLLGYIDGSGRGVSGLELALDDYLYENTTSTMMSVEVNARGYTEDDRDITFYESSDSAAYVSLTIDRDIQALAEELALESFDSGAIVILDAKTSECVAMVSGPGYSQNDVAASLEGENGALLNRALSAYNAGSVYKIVVAAAALEAGVSPDYSYFCTGEIEVNGHTYTCNNSTEHGYVDMNHALTVSCNGYFISLGQSIKSEAVYNMASAMGLGKPLDMFMGYSTSAGNMPTVAELNAYGELCNNCFGQGKLLVSPMHVAAYTACIANGGIMKNVSIVRSLGDEFVLETTEKRVMSEETVQIIAAGMKNAMETGTGSYGKSAYTSSAGKTGTAQTGRFNDNGTEIVNGWITGWFPADNPKYVITILTENAGSSSVSAAPVFGQLVDAFYLRGFVA